MAGFHLVDEIGEYDPGMRWTPKPVVLPSLLLLLVLVPTLVPPTAFGQVVDGDLPPIATSRFAVPDSSFRELRMIGEAAPAPITGETLHGEPLEAWMPGKTTMLLFWSPFVGGAGEHLARLAEVGRDNDHIEIASIGMGPKDRIEAVLADLPGRQPIPPRTVVDSANAGRRTFLEPLGLTELPAIVVIDEEGRVLYHGPVRTSSAALGQVVSRKFSGESYRRSALEYGARMNVNRLINEGRSRARRGEVPWDEVIGIAEEAVTLDPRNTPLRVLHFDTLLMDAARPDEAYEVGRRIMADFPTSPLTMNDLAWHVVSYPNVSRRDLDFALDAARRANAIQGGLDSAMLDTLARVHWMRGDAAEAIRIQRQAVGLAPDTWPGDETRANLDAYTSGRIAPGEMPPPYRSPRQPR